MICRPIYLLHITGPPNEPGSGLFCSLASVVYNAAGGPAGRRALGRSGGRHCTAGQYGYISLGRQLVISSVVVTSAYFMHMGPFTAHNKWVKYYS